MSKSLPRDLLAEAVGRVSMAWANAELAMSILLRALIDTDFLTAVAISTQADYSRRRDLMNSLATLKLNGNLKTDYDSIMSKLGGLSKERNAVVHGIFATIDGKERRLNINNRGVLTGFQGIESIARLNGISKRIAAVTNEIPALAKRVDVAVKAWREKIEPSIPVPPGFEERHQIAIPDKL